MPFNKAFVKQQFLHPHVGCVELQSQLAGTDVVELFVSNQSWKHKLAKVEATADMTPSRIRQSPRAWKMPLCTGILREGKNSFNFSLLAKCLLTQVRQRRRETLRELSFSSGFSARHRRGRGRLWKSSQMSQEWKTSDKWETRVEQE